MAEPLINKDNKLLKEQNETLAEKIAELDTNISIPLVHTNGKYMVMAEKNGQKKEVLKFFVSIFNL